MLEQPRSDGAQAGTVAPETCLARECIRDITVWGHDCRPAHDHKLQQAIESIHAGVEAKDAQKPSGGDDGSQRRASVAPVGLQRRSCGAHW